VHSLTAAAKLLENCTSVAATAAILEKLHFETPPTPLTRLHTAQLGIDPDLIDTSIAQGTGSLRVIVFEVPASADPRKTLTTTARALASRNALLWLIIAIDNQSESVTIAAIDSSKSHPPLATLTAQRSRIVDSDAETLSTLFAARGESDLLRHTQWLEILGREAVGRRFFLTLEQKVDGLARSLPPRIPPDDSRELALLCTSRLLFLSFLETKGWLNDDHGFLINSYADNMLAGGNYARRVLAPLFFGTLNTTPSHRARRSQSFGRIPFLNGGLFARSPLEKRHSAAAFTDEAIGDLYGDLLTRYRFTAHEQTTHNETAIDPEILGKSFECLMSSIERKTSGAFYTPQALVMEVTRGALEHSLTSSQTPRELVRAALSGEPVGRAEADALSARIDSLRVLDPACGSGAFLVHTLEELAHLRVHLGSSEPLHRVRRRVLVSSIFGVDVNPMAVWLCELRLWLSMAIEDPEPNPLRVTPLPNLDRNIRAGDSLLGEDFSRIGETAGRQVTKLRNRYTRATGPRKRSLARALDSLERANALIANTRRLTRLRDERREILSQARTRDLFGERPHPRDALAARLVILRARIRETESETRRITSGGALPFSFISGFADIADSGGFDIVLGNPPWIRIHNFTKEHRTRLRNEYQVYRNSAWRAGSDAAAAGKGFSAQVDAAALFVERSTNLLRHGGIGALILPSKLWRSLAGGGVRDFVFSNADILELHDLTSSKVAFDAVVYPSVLVTRRGRHGQSRCFDAIVHHDGTPRLWRARTSRLSFDGSPGSPWLIIPEDVRRAFDEVSRAGTPLAKSCIGRPLLGVKTGLNEAFLVRDPPREMFETGLMRPVIRGEDVKAWSAVSGGWMIWTHDDKGPLASLSPAALKRLTTWRRSLELRTDLHDRRRWWSVFRTEGADARHHRVVWSDIGAAPGAAYLPAGDLSVPLNTCYVARTPSEQDALALMTLINSEIIAAWLDVIAEPARGGYRRYMGWTMALLPLPREWTRAVSTLAPIGRSALNGSRPESHVVRSAVLDAYGLRESCVEPLLKWRE
jgi:hypothetical protein